MFQPWGSSELPELSYIIYTTNIPAIYDLCVREVTAPSDYPAGAYENGERFYYEVLPQDAVPWRADAVYRQYAGEEAYHTYVLCYENRVVVFTPGWDLTREQMAVVGNVFGK